MEVVQSARLTGGGSTGILVTLQASALPRPPTTHPHHHSLLSVEQAAAGKEESETSLHSTEHSLDKEKVLKVL